MTEDIDTRFCEFDLHRSTPSLSNFAPKWPASCWFEHRRHSTANCGWMVTDTQRSQWRAYRKPPLLSWMVPSLTPYSLPFSQNGVH